MANDITANISRTMSTRMDSIYLVKYIYRRFRKKKKKLSTDIIINRLAKNKTDLRNVIVKEKPRVVT